MRYFSIARASFSMSFRGILAFRANLLFESVASLTGAFASLAALGVVFTQTSELGGWGPAEAIVLLGTYEIVSGVRSTFIEPNVGWFQQQVTDGKLDDILLKPVPSLLLATLGTSSPLGLVQVLSGVVILLIGVGRLESAPTMGSILAWCVLLVASIAVTWVTRVMIASLAFWAPSFQPDVLYGAAWQLGRYPVSMYRQPIRFALTWVVPMAMIATLPAEALVRGPGYDVMFAGLAVTVAGICVVNWMWNAGLRRYTSATS
jgi:ABC-2 type transport system permease protein